MMSRRFETIKQDSPSLVGEVEVLAAAEELERGDPCAAAHAPQHSGCPSEAPPRVPLAQRAHRVWEGEQ